MYNCYSILYWYEPFQKFNSQTPQVYTSVQKYLWALQCRFLNELLEHHCLALHNYNPHEQPTGLLFSPEIYISLMSIIALFSTEICISLLSIITLFSTEFCINLLRTIVLFSTEIVVFHLSIIVLCSTETFMILLINVVLFSTYSMSLFRTDVIQST